MHIGVYDTILVKIEGNGCYIIRDLTMYIEFKTGYFDDGSAWIK